MSSGSPERLIGCIVSRARPGARGEASGQGAPGVGQVVSRPRTGGADALLHRMREGELLGLQWDDIDWARNLIDLRRTVAFRKGTLIADGPKSGKLRAIDVPVSLVARLRELRSIRQAEAAVAGTGRASACSRRRRTRRSP